MTQVKNGTVTSKTSRSAKSAPAVYRRYAFSFRTIAFTSSHVTSCGNCISNRGFSDLPSVCICKKICLFENLKPAVKDTLSASSKNRRSSSVLKYLADEGFKKLSSPRQFGQSGPSISSMKSPWVLQCFIVISLI